METIQNRKTKGQRIIDNGLKVCSRCIFDETLSAITFDENGVCNYCKMMDHLKETYKTGTPEGEAAMMKIVDQIKRDGKGKKYDVAVGVSGGTDSSYMLHLAIQWGLRPLAVHYDNTWNTSTATENIRKITSKLKVDLYTHVTDNKESDDIFRSFFRAGVLEIDGPTDIALAETMYRAASKYGIKYVLEGHSFIAEGVSPLGTGYVDGAYIKYIHRQFGKLKMKTFPNMDFMTFMKWILIKRIRKIRPLWYIKYSKEEAQKFLEKEFGWEYYGGHHLENRMTAFNHSVWSPQKFDSDQRNNSIAASVRAGILTRAEGIELYAKPPHIEEGLVEYFKKRLEISDEEYARVMSEPGKSYREYRTYKKRFEMLRPLFYVLAKAQLVPMSFYIKYTSKSEI